MAGKRTVVTHEAVELAVALLARKLPDSKVRRALTAAGFEGSRRSHSTILACARERQRRAANKPRDQHIREALSFYEAVITDAGASFRDKLKAQERIDGLLGLDAKYGDASATITALDVAAALTQMDRTQRPPAAVGLDTSPGTVQGRASGPQKRQD